MAYTSHRAIKDRVFLTVNTREMENVGPPELFLRLQGRAFTLYRVML